MTNGTSQGLFIVVAIVIFGIFVALSYTVFGNQLSPGLRGIFTDAITNVEEDTQDEEDTTYHSYFIVDENGRLIDYIGSETDIVIPETVDGVTVRAISNSALRNKGLTSVVIPETVRRIEGTSEPAVGAFSGNNITHLTLPDSLEHIGQGAFYSIGLEELTLGSNLNFIGSDAFFDNELTHLVIPDSVEIIDWHAFGNNLLETLELGSGLKHIDGLVFARSLLEEVTIPESVEYLGDSVFIANPLTEWNIPAHLEVHIQENPDTLASLGWHTNIQGWFSSDILNYY